MEANTIIKVFENYLCKVLKAISAEHGLEYKDLHEKYVASQLGKRNDESMIDNGNNLNNTGPSGSNPPIKREYKKNKTKTPKKKKDDSLQVTEFIYDGITYFVDQEQNVYTRDEDTPKLVGVRLVDGSVKFYSNDDY